MTYHWLTIERRFSDAPPADIFEYFTMYREHRIDPILPYGNLVFRHNGGWGRQGRFEKTIAAVCEQYDGINRAANLRYEDTGDTTTIRLYWYRDGTLEVEDTIARHQRYEPVGNWYLSATDTFEGIDPRYGQLLDPFREPVRLLKLDHGFYTLHGHKATYNHDAYEPCPYPPNDEVLAIPLAYKAAAYPVLERLSGIRRYSQDAVLINDTLLVRVASRTPAREIERRLREILEAGYTSKHGFRYQTDPETRDLTATHYVLADHELVVRETMESAEQGVVDHSYNPYTYEPDPAEYFSSGDFYSVSFAECYRHPIFGRYKNEPVTFLDA